VSDGRHKATAGGIESGQDRGGGLRGHGIRGGVLRGNLSGADLSGSISPHAGIVGGVCKAAAMNL
jgi:hypothetical protein